MNLYTKYFSNRDIMVLAWGHDEHTQSQLYQQARRRKRGMQGGEEAEREKGREKRSEKEEKGREEAEEAAGREEESVIDGNCHLNFIQAAFGSLN